MAGFRLFLGGNSGVHSSSLLNLENHQEKMDHRFRPTSGDRKKAEAGVLLKMDATLMELDSELTSGTSGFQSPTNNGNLNFITKMK